MFKPTIPGPDPDTKIPRDFSNSTARRKAACLRIETVDVERATLTPC
jgi:hypothetical protein